MQTLSAPALPSMLTGTSGTSERELKPPEKASELRA